MLSFNNLDIKIASSFKDRLIGLSFKRNIKYGMLFKNCKSIQTFFMLTNIDVIATDKDDNILKYYKDVKRGKIIITPKRTKNIYEIPCGIIKGNLN